MWDIADKIPTMCPKEIRRELADAASRLHDGDNVVEVGVWLGACTAAMLIGAQGKKIKIYSFDRFTPNASEIEKAKKAGVTLSKEKGSIELFKNYIKPFGGQVYTRRGCIKGITWNNEKIALYVDDASKRKPNFDHVMSTFQHAFIPGRTVLFLLDYFYYEKKSDDDGLKYQIRWMAAHKDHFVFDHRVGCAGVFKYVG